MNTQTPAPRSMMTECYTCVHRRNVPGNCHIACSNPDPEMRGNPHGVRNGWFFYPLLFDPTWKTEWCNNYRAQETEL